MKWLKKGTSLNMLLFWVCKYSMYFVFSVYLVDDLCIWFVFHILHCILTVEDECHRVVVLCILYHISMSDKCSALFSYTDCIPMVGVLWCVLYGRPCSQSITMYCRTQHATLCCNCGWIVNIIVHIICTLHTPAWHVCGCMHATQSTAYKKLQLDKALQAVQACLVEVLTL